MDKPIEVYAPVDPTADYSIRNIGEGVVVINDGLMGTEIQIGEAKRRLYLMIKALDRQAAEWGVPNNLNKQGVERKQMTRKIEI